MSTTRMIGLHVVYLEVIYKGTCIHTVRLNIMFRGVPEWLSRLVTPEYSHTIAVPRAKSSLQRYPFVRYNL